jgi:DNA gyrase subunit B
MLVQSFESYRSASDGKVYEQEYEKGKALYPVKQIGETTKGTIVTFILIQYFTQTRVFL